MARDLPLHRHRLTVRGTVQGVGFRPSVFRLASELGLSGFVQNGRGTVRIEAQGARVAELAARIRELPSPIVVESVEEERLPLGAESGFHIATSDDAANVEAVLPADLALCSECRRETLDPRERRFGYPFTNCTRCGPRFSIALGLPYDRERTSMRRFELCADCRREYEWVGDRRFHAEPIACPVCGPQLRFLAGSGSEPSTGDRALELACAAIERGEILALMGLGGFQLLVDATSPAAVARLRERKRRERKPFAVLFRSRTELEKFARVTEHEAALLGGSSAPIVLLRRVEESGLAPDVAPGCLELGALLPYTPLHLLLTERVKVPLVCTSGNVSEEPLCVDENEARERLAGIADGFLVHDRPIVRAVDDSVARTVAGKTLLLRRARGFAPRAVARLDTERTVLALGAHMKSTIALVHQGQVIPSQHLGDLDCSRGIANLERTVEDFCGFFGVTPELVCADLHPDYASRHLAEELARRHGAELVLVQHHHAHVASALAEHGLEGPVLGFGWDGTGLGTDGAVWGGEVLRVEGARFERVAHLRTFRLPGGDQASRDGRRSALGLLHAIDPELASRWARAHFAPEAARGLVQLLDTRIAAPITSSMGRLFDGLAVLLGLGTHSSYEGELARALEVAATDADVGELPAFPLSNGVLDFEPLVRAALSARDVARTAAAIHAACVDAIVRLAETAGIERVVLSGGCFQNTLLLAGARARLEARGFSLFTPELVPINDGGISVGQAFVACVSESQAGS